MSDDLAAKVLAAIEETEQAARAVQDENPSTRGTRYPYPERLAMMLHIAHHGPASVLRRCAADREILGEYQAAATELEECALTMTDPARGEFQVAAGALGVILRLLAKGYGITEEDT